MPGVTNPEAMNWRQRVDRELRDVGRALLKLAHQDEKILALTEKVANQATDLEVVKRDLYGPEGILVKQAKSQARQMVLMGLLSAVGSAVLVVLGQFFLGL